MSNFVCVVHFLLFLSLIGQGNCCEPVKNLQVSQAGTGADVGGTPQWRVTILNDCICDQFNIKVACDGFKTVEPVDPSVLANTGDGSCLVNKGQPLHGNQTLSFTYAWDAQYPFKPVKANIACS